MSARLGFLCAIVVAGAVAAGWPAVFGPVAVAQENGCALSRRDVDTRTDRPIVNMRKTLVETGEITHTDEDGVWTFRVAGAGRYTVASSHPDYAPVTRRYVLDERCDVTSATDVVGGGGMAPAAVAPPEGTPTSSARPAGAHRFTGVVTVEGQPAPAGTRVSAYVGETLCGSGSVFQAGRYSVDVLPQAARPDCASATGLIQFAVTPAFGENWRLGGTALFLPDAETGRDLDVDLAQLRPRADNVPWIDVVWEEPRRVAIGICSEIAPMSEEAVRDALAQWEEALRDRGLLVQLVPDGDAACGERSPGIAIIEDDIGNRSALAGASFRTADFRPCPRTSTCFAFKSVIAINRRSFARVDAVERANVIAHEIGHALGLDHAIACNGGTIMWRDTQCRYPLRSIGVDDIASLNAKVGGGVPATSQPADLTRERGSDYDASLARVAATGSIGDRLRADTAALLARLPEPETLLDEALSYWESAGDGD